MTIEQRALVMPSGTGVIESIEGAPIDGDVDVDVDENRNWTGSEIRQLRYRMGWSRAELARQMNLSFALVSDWELGIVLPGDADCNMLLRFLRLAESHCEKMQRRPIAEVVMRDRGLSQIHDLDVIEAGESLSHRISIATPIVPIPIVQIKVPLDH